VKAANLAQGEDGAMRPGAVVTRITPGGPAAAAGLRVGDVVVKFDHHEVADSRALTRMVGDATIGGHVEMEVLRAGRRVLVSAIIARLAEEQATLTSL
jgi:serine protease Do